MAGRGGEDSKDSRQGVILFFILYKWGESPWGQRDRSALQGGSRPPPQSSLLREQTSRASLSRLLPPILSATLTLPSCPCCLGWRRGLEGQGGWVVPVRHMSRGGLGRVCSSCQSVPGSLVPAGDKSREPCFLGRESQPPGMGHTILDRWVGRGTALSPTPLAPVGSGGCLLSGSSLSQDCARRVLLGFRGAVRRPGSGGPEMTVRAGLAYEWGSQAGCSSRL